MQQQEIHNFLERYFAANECDIVENAPGILTVQLTVAMDKELMNRPFYWHYLEKTGGTANPMKVTFITNHESIDENVSGERIHFGSPRLHQIFTSASNIGKTIRLYEEPPSLLGEKNNTALQPWLVINVKVSYICDRKKDYIWSLGLHLISGNIIENFHDKLEKISLTPKIPDFCFTITPIIRPQSGLTRLEHYINGKIQADDHSWADEARKRWQTDIDLLNHFYEHIEEKPSSYQTELQALQDQYEPHIRVNVINGGIFYLTPNTMKNLT
ncbi:hypothetical protein EJF36_13575 [Bacillus sp. HMF5848]|uniref:YqhG family protein n=1 Tax=Bacillus sp. HMF5848 TaxID=2495421 RepID=UPI000F7A1462|nr:YqhG family protein [Bacillus sp. HMF5848]RSK27823.1 hypothetical protein EJF36_13575 [Bacillus sp. HMF5848]